MTNFELFKALGYISAGNLSGAEQLQTAPRAVTRGKSWKRPVLIAAVIALALLLVGCSVAVALRLQALTIPENTSGIPRETNFSGEEINPISIQGYMGTDSYAAFREWREFLSTYDPDNEILHANNDFQKPDAYYSYNCYSQEMVDKIDEICRKYNLQPLGKPWFFDRLEDILEAVGVGDVFAPDAQIRDKNLSGYCYQDGSFSFEGFLKLTGEWNKQITFDYRSVQKTSFDGVTRNIRDVNEYDQWEHKMKDGTTALLALQKSGGLIIVDKADSFVTVGISGVFANGSYFGDLPTDRAFLNAVCDVFDFSYQTHPVDDSKADALLEAQLEREANGENTQGSDGVIDPAFCSGYAQWIDYMVNEENYEDLKYALIDVDGDGVEELLLQCEHVPRYDGNKNSFFSLFTMKDGEVWVIAKASNLYLCEEGVIDNAFVDSNSHYYFTKEHTLEAVVYSQDKWYKNGDWGAADDQVVDITEEEAATIIAKYPHVEIDFKPIDEFPRN